MMEKLSTNFKTLPVVRDLKLVFISSMIVAFMMTFASVAGLVYTSSIYTSEELLQSFVSNDVINLIIGLPILLGSMWLAWRGKLIGLLFWPGAIFYVIYNYIVYTLAMPIIPIFILYPALVLISILLLIWLLTSFNGKSIQEYLEGKVRERFAGGILAGFGGLFFLRAVALIFSALSSQTSIANTELALHIADIILSLALVIGGVALWRRQALGYMAGLGLLFMASMLFIGLILLMLLQPTLTGAPIVYSDLLVITFMGMICFIPFGLFVRGVLSKKTCDSK
jgi:hypothetical protein